MTASSTEPGPGAAADRPALPGWGSIVRAIPTALLLMLILVVPAFLLGWFSNPASFGVVYLGSMVAWLVMISAGLRAALAASVALLLLTFATGLVDAILGLAPGGATGQNHSCSARAASCSAWCSVASAPRSSSRSPSMMAAIL